MTDGLQHAGPEGERRQVTVLFADLVGFTAFSEQSGEEAAYRLVQRLTKLLRDAVQEQGGSVRSFTGDGVMALFGVPQALEDAPLRACRAALAIQEQLTRQATEIEAVFGVRPWLRIGINAGTAIVGRVDDEEGATVTALGDTINLAARLQALAEPGTVLLTETAQRLVEGMVEGRFAGEHTIKGKVEPQRVFLLEAVRKSVARFDAAVSRGLTAYVGRDRELEALVRHLSDARNGLRVVDVVGDPGIGKSRLIYEFRQRIGNTQAFVLAGSCSPDGQQTALLPFIEVVRGSFRIAAGEAESAVARKLENGLRALGLDSAQNLGLLLNLLGLAPPEGALSGLDGTLVGLKTRDLLQQLFAERCRLSPVLLILEDLHWIDGASEELLGKIVENGERLALMIAETHRPEYTPHWRDRPSVHELALEPLSSGETARIVEARLGKLPDTLARFLGEKAEGNALFAEELASFLLERGMIQRGSDRIVFDTAATVASPMPASVQSLLAARIDRLSADDRAMLQAAAVIGRNFDVDLLGAVAGGDSTESLATAAELDLIRRHGKSGEYIFKHVLVRDALYETLLGTARAALHLKTAEEIERRSGNRLPEVAEVLAHHYKRTIRADKAFQYLALSGRKSLDRYSVGEAEGFLRDALSLLEREPQCAKPKAIADVIVDILETLFLKTDLPELLRVAKSHLPTLEAMGDTPQLCFALYFLSHTQCNGGDFRAADATARRALEIAERIKDAKAIGRARTALLFCMSAFARTPLETAQRECEQALADAERAGDNFNLNWAFWNVAWDYMSRGLIKEAAEWAWKLAAFGRERDDRRAIGLAYWTLAWIDILNACYDDALANADECLRTAVTPWDHALGSIAKSAATLFQGNIETGLEEIQRLRRWAAEHYARYADAGMQPAAAVGLVLSGRIAEGIHALEDAIADCDAAEFRSAAAWNRITLAEIYLEMLLARRRPPAGVILRNLGTILHATIFGARRARVLLEEAATNEQLHERGALRARINMDLGFLCKHKKQTRLARQYLEKARVPAEAQGAAFIVKKIDAALAEL